MPDVLHTCPVCLTANFTARGLTAHKCKGGTRLNPDTGLVEVVKPMSPLALSARAARTERDAAAAGQAVDCEVLLPAAATPAADPAALIEGINGLHREATALASQARELGDSATRKAILLGLRLIQLREATPHGQWESLFSSGQKRVGKANATHAWHLDFSAETARRYIAVTTRLTAQKLLPEQSAALMAIGHAGEPTEAECALLDELVPAKSLRQLQIEMGIIKPTPKELAAMTAGDDAAHHAPAKPEKPLSPADELARDRDRARESWFGTPKIGSISPGSILSIIQLELDHPKVGTLHLLRKADLDVLARDFQAFAKACSKIATSL